MPAGGSPQPMSVDPDRSTPTRVREAVLQCPQSTLSTGSGGSAHPKPHLPFVEFYPGPWNALSLYLLMTGQFFKANNPVGEVIAANTNSADLQGLYESLKLLTATVVEVACTQDIILAPPQAAPSPPNTKLAQVLSAIQALSQKVTKLETAASKTPTPPKPATKPPPTPTFLSVARAAANKPQPPPPPPKPAAKRRQPTKVVGLPEEGLHKWVITPAVRMKDLSTRPSPLAIVAKLNGKPSSNSVLTAYWTPAGNSVAGS
ncbi:hypothetical protein H0H81_004128 [Sphagnurus paluster]|uniref:Uncharacterized protein n=1 Tax=Sphagnurus paluster TaxID=117069 RepID=A0A9P7FLM9_9AGAR|nr:hypothetical protein H0H81_004128 [Sphagnurus paluster]